ncbi:MAG: hypothetical protein ACI4PQ_06080 [Butyricicoccaceae bacterium]
MFTRCAAALPETDGDALALILNEPFDRPDLGTAGALVQSMTPTDTFAADGKYDRAYIVPRDANSTIELFEVEYDPDTQAIRKTNRVFSATNSTLIYGAFDRPEGVPLYQLTVTTASGTCGELIFAYNGRDGTPAVESVCTTR